MGEEPAIMNSRLALCLVAATLLSVAAAKSASASHILVASEDKINEIKNTITSSDDQAAAFAEQAKAHSTCPSGKSGGSLGSFGPGQMVPEFDKVIWEGDIKSVLGPVKTQFGHHLIWISERSE